MQPIYVKNDLTEASQGPFVDRCKNVVLAAFEVKLQQQIRPLFVAISAKVVTNRCNRPLEVFCHSDTCLQKTQVGMLPRQSIDSMVKQVAPAASLSQPMLERDVVPDAKAVDGIGELRSRKKHVAAVSAAPYASFHLPRDIVRRQQRQRPVHPSDSLAGRFSHPGHYLNADVQC